MSSAAASVANVSLFCKLAKHIERTDATNTPSPKSLVLDQKWPLIDSFIKLTPY